MDQADIEQELVAEAFEHRDVILDIRAILVTKSGRNFFKYLFKHFDVCELPEFGLEGTFLADRLGFLRAGNSVFKLVAEADADSAASLLSQKESERYAKLQADARKR